MLLFPVLSAAQTFTVDSLADESSFEGCVNPSTECTLRDAIIRANEIGGDDEIVFDGVIGGPIEVDEGPLPGITQPVVIDATTASGWAGSPVVEIDGDEAETEGTTIGLDVFSGGSVQVKGLAITGFGIGVDLAGASGSRLCGNYLGVDLSGTAAAPNEIGLQVSSTGVRVGGGPCEGEGNVISGNSEWGVYVSGADLDLIANQVGTDAFGDPLPNGDGGVHVAAAAFETAIGGPILGEDELGPGNVIAHNGGPGVQVEDGSRVTAIYGNSIFDNSGLGIEVIANGTVPRPTLTSLTAGASATTVGGTLSGGQPATSYIIDLYANAACDPSGSGEGKTYLGSQTVGTNGSGVAAIDADELDALPAGEAVITATATELLAGGDEETSEFSQCFSLPAPPGPPAPGPPLAGPPPSSELTPVNGELLVAAPQSGTIKVKVPGQNKFKTLEAGAEIPVGSIVDATNGKVTLTSINKEGEVQTAVFYGGRFLIAQKEGSGLVVLKLRGGNFSACASSARGSAAIASGKSGRKLWGSGKGKFRTEGSYGSATVRGTVWLTEDRCSGTFFKTRKGVVSIRDFVSGTNFSLPAGKSYLAKKEG